MTTPSDALAAASRLRIPQMVHPIQPKVLIDALMEYTLTTAWHQGELSQHKLEAMLRLQPLDNQWDALEGWQGLVKARTDKGVQDAKRMVDPKLYQRIKAGRFLISRLSEEMERLEKDATKASRVYSMLSGS